MNINEAKKLINEWGGALPKFLRLMYDSSIKNPFPHVQVSLGGGAWTDNRKLYVGLWEEMVEGNKIYDVATKALKHEPTIAEGSTSLKGLGYHELFHIFYSSWKEMENFDSWWLEEFKTLWEGKSDIHKNVVHKLGHKFNNAVEDGRIENLGVNKFPGCAEALRFNRLFWWSIESEMADIKANTPKVPGAPLEAASDSKFLRFMNAACYYASLGIFPASWANETDPEMYKNMDIIRGDIDDFICCGSPVGARRKLQKMILKIKDFLMKLLEDEMAQADMMAALQEFIQSLVDEFKGCEAADKSSKDVSGSGISIRIKMPGSSGGSSSDEGEEGDSEDGDGSQPGSAGEGDEESEDGTGNGKSKDEADSKDADKKGSAAGKDGKDGEEGKGSQDGKGDEANKPGNNKSIQNERKAPNHAERGGDESSTAPSKPNSANNNGQGTSSGNVAPDKSDETVSTTSESLKSAVEQQLDVLSSRAQDSYTADKNKIAKIDKQEASTSEGVTKAEVEAIRKGYEETGGGGYYGGGVEGYKEVEVTARAKPDNKIVAMGKVFRKEIEKLLKSQVDSCIRGVTRGRLSTGMLHRMQRKDFSIFEVKNTPDKTDAVVYILWDNSGSMCGEKQRLSTIACSVIEEGLKGLIPLKITAFATEGSMVKHWKIKNFNERDKGHNYAYSHGTARGFNGGNKDGYSIKIATAEIVKRSEKLKLLIVLSDGLPSDYPSTSYGMNDVKEAVRDARKKGVEVISVMFGESGFRESEFENYVDMYKSGIVSSSPEKLTDELIKQIRKILFNKGR